MFRKAILSLALLPALVALAVAADPVGRWKGQITGAAELNVNYTFTAEGSTLNGSIDLLDHGASFPIQGGTIKGDSIRFTVDFAGMATMSQRGAVVGDTLFLMTHFGDGNETPGKFTRIP
jgi:hypothetical protein